MTQTNVARHYPFAHRHKAVMYPWDATVNSYRDFDFDQFYGPVFSLGSPFPTLPVRLGKDIFVRISDMLKDGFMTDDEKSLMSRVFPNNRTFLYAFYDYNSATLPSGMTVYPGLNRLLITFSYYRNKPLQVQSQRRSRSQFYAMHIAINLDLSIYYAPWNQVTTLQMSYQYGNLPDLDTSLYIETCPLPTIHQCGGCEEQIHTMTKTPADTLTGSSTLFPFFNPPPVITYLDDVKNNLLAELATQSFYYEVRAAAVAGCVPSTVPNAYGTNSLQTWSNVDY